MYVYMYVEKLIYFRNLVWLGIKMCYKRYYEYKIYKFNIINVFYFCVYCLCLLYIVLLWFIIILVEYWDWSLII